MAKKINTTLHFKSQTGDIGLEIEVEGVNLPESPDTSWRKEADSSLRGESGEYVFTRPLSSENSTKALQNLIRTFRDNETVVHDSFRAGVHVHINVQNLTYTELVNYVCLYLMFEESLVDFCSPSRRGNHFCLRLQDADYLGLLLASFIRTGDVSILSTEDIRYASINLLSLFKYGSVEFRALETPTLDNFDKIDLWSKILLRLREKAQEFPNPTEVVGTVSNAGYMQFAQSIFGEYWDAIKNCFTEEKIRRGMRNIQHVAYARSWNSVNRNIFITKSVF